MQWHIFTSRYELREVQANLLYWLSVQSVPIPSYLIAIAAGNIHFRSFPPIPGKKWTSGIWTEPELLEAAYWEFSEDTTKFLDKEESIVSSYQFGIYDLLVLPPSFPYGGMVSDAQLDINSGIISDVDLLGKRMFVIPYPQWACSFSST